MVIFNHFSALSLHKNLAEKTPSPKVEQGGLVIWYVLCMPPLRPSRKRVETDPQAFLTLTLGPYLLFSLLSRQTHYPWILWLNSVNYFHSLSISWDKLCYRGRMKFSWCLDSISTRILQSSKSKRGGGRQPLGKWPVCLPDSTKGYQLESL